MLHFLDQVREPVDHFERALVNGLAGQPGIDALWVREVGAVGALKRVTKMIFVQLARQSRAASAGTQQVLDELARRASVEPFDVELHFIVDDLPPADIAPSCIWRRR